MNQDILLLLKNKKINSFWAFAKSTRRETTYVTHGYHRYPAKFIPQVVSNLIKKYTKEDDLVIDPFAGCGTTLVEAKIMGRPSIGIDINPVAVLITKAKIASLEPSKVAERFLNLKKILDSFDECIKFNIPEHERIDFWFRQKEKEKLSFLFSEISKEPNQDIQKFFYCGLSNILKNCSIWLQKSNKPTRDFEKKPADPFVSFSRQIKAMLRGNADFFNLLQAKQGLDAYSKVYCADARKVPVKDNSASLIVTSPPYVTSYEYADLHQLTAIWFEYTKGLSSFRKRFIGTAYHNKKEIILNSEIAEVIKTKLMKIHKKTAEGVATYFSEMNQAFTEMKRILKKNGRVCIVIGNTNLKGIEILNVEVFIEQLQNLGFKIEDIIKREIPSKNLPSTRDKETGRFTKVTDTKKVLAYPTEYILIMKKL